MKKTLSLVLALVMTAALFCACASRGEKPDETPAPEAQNTLKLGMYAVVNRKDSAAAAAGQNGKAASHVTVAAVLVDDKGVILDCVVDGIQGGAEFDAGGALVGEAAGELKPHSMLDTLMETVTGTEAQQKPWREQAGALAGWFIGKTAAEVGNIPLNEEGMLGDSALLPDVTMAVDDVVMAVRMAASGAKTVGAMEGDDLRLGVVGSMSANPAAEGADGMKSAQYDFAAVTVGKDGRITACQLDSVEVQVTFAADGTLTGDMGETVRTKNQLGTAYGMAEASAIGKEWFEQAQAFAAYLTGKTMTDVRAVPVDDSYKPTEPDLKSSVTISVQPFIKAVEAAMGETM